MVRPEMATVLPGPTWNTRLLAFPSTARLPAPGPEMVMFLSTSSSPLVNTIVPDTAKVIVSPSFAVASAWRNEPAPLSLVFVTVMVAACAVIITAQISARAIAANLILGAIFVFMAVVVYLFLPKILPGVAKKCVEDGSRAQRSFKVRCGPSVLPSLEKGSFPRCQSVASDSCRRRSSKRALDLDQPPHPSRRRSSDHRVRTTVCFQTLHCQSTERSSFRPHS